MPRMCDTVGVWCERCPDDQCLGGDYDVMIGAKPYPKPKFGAENGMPPIEQTPLRSEAHVCDAPAQYKAEGIDMRVGKTVVAADLTEESFLAAAAQIMADQSVLRPTQRVVPLDRLKAELAKGDALYGDRPDRIVIDDPLYKKPRAKYGTATYGGRDPDARRKYLREYMKKRRAAAKAIINQPGG